MSFLRAVTRPLLTRPFVSSKLVAVARTQRFQLAPRAGFASAGGLKREEVEARVLDVFKDFDKVNVEKLTPSASFIEDLALDSLDSVEVVMAVEEEFSIEIPDAEADEIKTVGQAIEYILKSPEAQ